ncbi:hypothetical protein BH10ACI3_BH10ACI3_06980 [soil metagenome]
MDIQLLDAKAISNVLKTLPENIRKEVESKIDKNGLLKVGSLDKIKSKDDNFQSLKGFVNNKALTEVMTATEATGNPAKFYQRTAAENQERDIQDYMKSNGVSRDKAEQFYKTIDTSGGWVDSNYLGYTLNPSESPSGNLRIVVTDQTGEASGVSEEDAVVTTGHELYAHGELYRQGKPYEHGKVSESVFTNVEERTRNNYRGEQIKNTPTNIKPKH